jgi:hypothetical protein
MTTKLRISIIFFALFFSANKKPAAQSPNWIWAQAIGGFGFDYAYSVAMDPTGSALYTTGYFEGTVDFDLGAGNFNLTAAGSFDIFLNKKDSAGNLIWTKAVGGSGGDAGYSIAVDPSGNGDVYLSGSFVDTVDFDPGPGIFNLKSAGTFDIFILKLDSAGNFIWVKQMGGIRSDYAYAIALDTAGTGDVYLTGYFEDTVDFDPGIGTFNLISSGGLDIFISKLDSAGNFLWAKSVGGIGVDYGLSLAIDPSGSGDVYSTGAFERTVDFDPGIGTASFTSSALSQDMFIVKLDSAGNYKWANTLGGTNADISRSITIDKSGSNIYFTGNFSGTVDFDPGAAIFNLTSAGFYDIFISKSDSSGNFVWTKTMGGTDFDFAYSIITDRSGNGDVYITGNYQGIFDFDPGTDTFSLASAGSFDVFLSRFDTSGNFVWAKGMGGLNADIGQSVTIDPAGGGDVYLAGYFESTSISFGAINLLNADITGLTGDLFIAKLDSTIVTFTGETQKRDNDFFISPNPAGNYFTIIHTGNSAITEVTISDLTGKLIYQNEFYNRIEINSENFVQGIYLIQMTNGDIIQTNKLIIVSGN